MDWLLLNSHTVSIKISALRPKLIDIPATKNCFAYSYANVAILVRSKPQYFLAFLLAYIVSLNTLFPCFHRGTSDYRTSYARIKPIQNVCLKMYLNPYCLADRKSDIRGAGPTAWGRFKENNRPARGDEFFILGCPFRSTDEPQRYSNLIMDPVSLL